MVSFQRWAKWLLALFLCLPAWASAGDVINTTYSRAERVALAQWAQDNAQSKLSLEKATAWVDHVYLQAFHHQLDPLLILAMMRLESGFQENARSPMGATGLMQVIPKWHRDKLRGRNPMNPMVSIEVGSQVLGDCWKKHKPRLQRVMNCYSGGAQGYEAKVRSWRNQMKGVLVAHRALQEPLYAEAAPVDYGVRSLDSQAKLTEFTAHGPIDVLVSAVR